MELSEKCGGCMQRLERWLLSDAGSLLFWSCSSMKRGSLTPSRVPYTSRDNVFMVASVIFNILGTSI